MARKDKERTELAQTEQAPNEALPEQTKEAGVIDPSEPEHTSRYLMCVLTKDELLEEGRLLSDTSQKLEALLQEKKAAMAEYKSREEDLRTKIGQAAGNITRGHVWRDIECEVGYPVPFTGKKTLVRLDNGDIFEEKMSADEIHLFNCRKKEEEETKKVDEPTALPLPEGKPQ